MPARCSTSRLLLALGALLLSVSSASGQVAGQGAPWYTIPLPLPGGFVDAATGNVHLEIPIASIQERNGDPLMMKAVYDTTFYSYSGFFGVSGPGWQVFTGNSHWGWGSYNTTSQDCSINYPQYPIGSVNFNYFYFVDSHSTSHLFSSVWTMQVSCKNTAGQSYGAGNDIVSTSALASDASAYTLNVKNYTNFEVIAPDGTIVADNGFASYAGIPIDTNGNYTGIGDGSGAQSDMLGRSPFSFSPDPFIHFCKPDSSSIGIRASDGSTNTYTFTCTSLPIAEVFSGTQKTGTGDFLTNIGLPDGTHYSFTYDTGSSGTHLGNLLGITLPSGGVISLTYPTGGETVTFAGGTWTRSASYNSSTRQTTTTVTAPTRYDFASKTNVNDKTVFTSVPSFSYIQSAQYYNGSSTVLKTVSTTYDTSGLYLPLTVTTTLNDTGQSSSVYYQYYNQMRDFPTQKQETDFSGTVVRTTKTAYNPSFMKPTSVNVYAGSGTGSPIASTLFTYDEYTANYCKNSVPMLTSVTGATSHDDTHFGLSFTNRGNVTTVQRLIAGSTYSTTHYCYDTLGNVTQSVDANGNPTSFDYTDSWADTDCIPSGTITRAFPTTVTDALGHKTQSAYFTCSSKLQSVKDQNDINAARSGISYTYDLFGRLLSTTGPAGGSTTDSYSPSTPSVSTSTTTGTGGPITTTTLEDAYGRAYQNELTSDPEGTDYSAKTFDALGRDSQTYNPTRCNPPTTNCGESTWGSSTTTYDAFGRVTSVTAPDGSVGTATYSGPCSTSTDAAGKLRKVCNDAFGRTIQVLEDPGTSPHLNFETDYTYDVLNNLLTVNQKGGSTNSALWRTRTFTYDSVSRLLTAANPESGTTTYTYNNNGNVLTKKDARNITTTYYYDSLNRIGVKQYSDSTPSLYFYYDVAPSWMTDLKNVVGRLANMNNSHGGSTDGLATAATFSYDPMGRIVRQWQQTPSESPGGSFTYFSYDLAGNPTSASNAAGITISYAYDAVARPVTVTSSLSDAQHPATLYTVDPSIGYFPIGALRKATLANGLTESTMYNVRLQPCRLEVNSTAASFSHCTDAVPSGNVLDFTYGYNSGTSNNGNIASWWSVGNQTFTRSYGYDSVNRISTFSDTATVQTCRGLSWTIDPWGNRTDQTVTSGTCGIFHATVGANNQFGSPYQYDAAGNMISDGTHTYTYDAENHLTQVDSGSTASYVYDPIGRRVRKNSGGSWYEYFYDISGNVTADLNASGWLAEYLYLDGQLIGQYYAGTTYSISKDHLGSTRLITKLDKSVCDSLDFLPFGEQLAGGSTCTTYEFTGFERDSESALDYAGARYNSSSLGRFMSSNPENAGADPANPQSWNGYAYVYNDPLNSTDPDGLAPTCTIDGGEVPCETANRIFQQGASAECPFRNCLSGWQFVTNNAGQDGLFNLSPLGSPLNPINTSCTSISNGFGTCTLAFNQLVPFYFVNARDAESFCSGQGCMSFLKMISDFGAGGGDCLTGRCIPFVQSSLTQWTRGSGDDVVSKNSGSYAFGEFIGGLDGAALLSGGGATAAAIADGKEGAFFGRAINNPLFNGDALGGSRLRFGWNWDGTALGGRNVIRLGIGAARGKRWFSHIIFWSRFLGK